MKRINIYAIILLGVSMASGCNLLDYDESTGRTKDEAFSYIGNVINLSTNVYSYLSTDLSPVSGAMMESATDNSVYTWESNQIYDMNNGTWNADNTIDNAWNLWDGIRSANIFLENFDLEALERFEHNADYEDQMKIVVNLPYEVRFLRAYYHFELARRYGDIPLLKRTYSETEINDVEKTPFDEVIDFVASECAEVAGLLPEDYNDLSGSTGRVTKGTALALRSRALLYAASPLHNPDGDKDKWQRAAEAAHDVIAMNRYEMQNISSDPLYQGDNAIFASKQLIFERRARSKESSFEARNVPMGYVGAQGGNTPTQNLVDAFEMKDGTPFDWNNADHVSNMYYDATGAPTRDPRLYLNVLVNGSEWSGRKVETFENGRDAFLNGSTRTGYYLRKHMNADVSLDPNKPNKLYHHFVLFRYAEILLNYAEAMYEWVGPDIKPEELTLTAREALNMVRASADMKPVDLKGEEFKEKVRNERRIELAFEGHRIFDIRRWKIAGDESVKNIYGVKIVRAGDTFMYSRTLVESRVWEDRMYLYPVPQNEAFMCGNLQQNTGW